MKKSKGVMIGGVAFGVLLIGLFPIYSKVLIKEGKKNLTPNPEVERLTAKKKDFVERISQLRPGGTLSGRLIDLEARKEQLIQNYPDGHADINILEGQIAELRKALQKLPQLEAEYAAINQNLEIAMRKNQAPAKEPLGTFLLKEYRLQAPRLRYEGEANLVYQGDAKALQNEIALLRQAAFIQFSGVKIENVPGQPSQIVIRGAASTPGKLVSRLTTVSEAIIASSLARQTAAVHDQVQAFQTQHKDFKARFTRLVEERKNLLAGPISTTPNAQLIAKIEELKARRRQLIENYPTHSDVVALGVQIRTLLGKTTQKSPQVSEKVFQYDRQINETKVWMDYLGRRIPEFVRDEQQTKSEWKMVRPVVKPSWPKRVEGWPMAVGGLFVLFPLGYSLYGFIKRGIARKPLANNGLWRDPAKVTAETRVTETAAAAETAPALETVKTAGTPVELEVVSPENLPSDPMTQHAASLYSRWVEVAKLLYTPAQHAPEGVLESVTPLLMESSEFLPDGHDVMARYLARSVEPGNLAAHVARTVLMALAGAQEAGASPEHRYAMALAALFHDLAMVPRPPAQQEEVGSEIGRLSAVLLKRIPGLAPALLSMVEEILIGMDEHKLETWQNVAHGRTLEPLSKVLREIDRFEKVMQKQKARLDRQLKPAANA